MSKQKARVFSYIRFSTPEQAMGDSERRQLDEARAWAKRNALELDESLTPDRGLSGFHGDHRKRGALGTFLAKVEAGEIPAGSILLVENVDRLSREGFVRTLREVIFKLWDHGIVLQTLTPEETYRPGCDNDPKFIALFLFLQRAQDESQRKSERVRKARDQARHKARDEKRILTRRAPAWLFVQDGQFAPILHAADTIRRIFELKLQGLGVRTIEKKLNTEATWQPPTGGGWRASYIRKILTNRAVLGEYQPHERSKDGRAPVGEPIAEYYPQIVRPDVFHAVQAKMKKAKGGQVGKANNLLRYLAVCAYCGGPMAFIDKGGKGKKYLTCDNGRRRVKCKRYTIRYDEVERLLLDNAPDLRPDQVLPDPDAQSRICFSLRQRIVGNEEEIENIEAQVENLVDQIARTRSDSMRDRYENKIAKLTEQKKALGAAVETDQAELQKAQGALKSLTNWKRNLATLKKELQTGGVEIRMRLQAHLREMIERVEIFAHGEPGEAYEPVGIDRTGKGTLMHFRRDNGDWHVLSQEEGASFLAYVDKRRNSKEGRFIRVYFKSGAFAMDLIPEDDFAIDLVPDGSLASGLTFSRPGDDVVDAWDAEEPSFDRLYREFQAQVNL